MTSIAQQPMAWSNEKIRLTCIENIGLRQLWKLIALDNSKKASSSGGTTNSDVSKKSPKRGNFNEEKISVNINNNNSGEQFMNFLSKRDYPSQNKMSLLKFLAINALDLSAPAAPVLLERQHQKANTPEGWMQLSGHPESIVPTAAGIVRKRVSSSNDCEVKAYEFIKNDSYAKKLVPKFLGPLEMNGETYIELQDLLYGFKDPNVMDIKMGCRTFLESEVSKKILRPDLYKKMIAVNPSAPTAEEHELQAITKLRYMLFREEMSSSHSKGFRIEAMRQRGQSPVNNLKTVSTNEQIIETILEFLNGRKNVTKELIERLIKMRSHMEKSEFFRTHEIIGSSIFIVYDDSKVGVWLIDFAKSGKLPEETKVDHRKPWVPGNREEGFLKGMDELISAIQWVENIQNSEM